MMRLLPTLILLAAVLPSLAAQSGTPPPRAGVYTAAQADRGAKTYDTQCVSCHPAEEFTGRFLTAWNGRAADGLFETIRTSMPEDNPGGLARRDYADILAFIFRQNGFPPGPRELEGTPAALKQIVIEVP